MTALRNKRYQEDEPVKLSICSITYNHGQFIEECLEGFLDQVLDGRVEIIIHDDASNDDTSEIIRRYAELYPTIIRTILQTDNQFSKGVNPYYAYVFPLARGQYIAVCDGDDFWSDAQKLARQVAVLDENNDVSLTYGRVNTVSESGVSENVLLGAERDLTAKELKSVPAINTLTTCFRNIFRDQPPPIFLRNSMIGDLTVWAMLGYHGRGHFMADMPAANYRLHSGGILSQQSEGRQEFMTAFAHLCISAYHYEMQDKSACRASAFIGLRSLVNLGVFSLGTMFKFTRRTAKNRLKNKSIV